MFPRFVPNLHKGSPACLSPGSFLKATYIFFLLLTGMPELSEQNAVFLMVSRKRKNEFVKIRTFIRSPSDLQC